MVIFYLLRKAYKWNEIIYEKKRVKNEKQYIFREDPGRVSKGLYALCSFRRFGRLFVLCNGWFLGSMLTVNIDHVTNVSHATVRLCKFLPRFLFINRLRPFCLKCYRLLLFVSTFAEKKSPHETMQVLVFLAFPRFSKATPENVRDLQIYRIFIIRGGVFFRHFLIAKLRNFSRAIVSRLLHRFVVINIENIPVLITPAGGQKSSDIFCITRRTYWISRRIRREKKARVDCNQGKKYQNGFLLYSIL